MKVLYKATCVTIVDGLMLIYALKDATYLLQRNLNFKRLINWFFFYKKEYIIKQ